MTTMPDISRIRLRIKELIETSWPAMLTTIDKNGMPVTRAMTNLRYNGENLAQSEFFAKQGDWNFFFRTHRSSEKVKHILTNNRANVYFGAQREMSGIDLIGTVKMLDDPKVKEILWREEWTNFFPYGVTDPEYAILKLTTEKVRLFLRVPDEGFERINLTVKELEGR